MMEIVQQRNIFCKDWRGYFWHVDETGGSILITKYTSVGHASWHNCLYSNFDSHKKWKNTAGSRVKS